MGICRCQVCGGNLILKHDYFAVCDSCHTEQFLPRIDSNVTNLYERANHMRIMANFDEAVKLFNKVLDQYPNDSATYWQIVLCKFGVLHQWDERTQTFKPTLHRMMRTSLLTDPDYQKALEYATTQEREIYHQEAENIFRIQQRYEQISKKEKDFDVFISYKETDDETHQRTLDSELAHSLYNDLTAQGLRVFFSHITLREKSGEDYEPYIFAALESSSVMLLVSTSPKYVNSVWVRNEWMRYLNLISTNEQKLLIPVIRDMNPYDLPDEIGHLQAINLRNVGAKQELLQRVVDIAKRNQTTSTPHPTPQGPDPISIEPLIEGMYRRLNERDFSLSHGAAFYIARIHAIDPYHVEGYIGKLMIEYSARTLPELANSDILLNTSENFQKIMRLGTEGHQRTLTVLLDKQQHRIYDECVSSKKKLFNKYDNNPKSVDINELKTLKKRFSLLIDYQDVKIQIETIQQLINQLLVDKAKQLEANQEYEQALNILSEAEEDDQVVALERKIRKAKERQDRKLLKEHNQENALKYFAIAIHSIVLIALLVITLWTPIRLFPLYVTNKTSLLSYACLFILLMCPLSNGLSCSISDRFFICELGHAGIPLLIAINTMLYYWQPGNSIFTNDFINGITISVVIGGIAYLLYTFIAWLIAKLRGCDFDWTPFI